MSPSTIQQSLTIQVLPPQVISILITNNDHTTLDYNFSNLTTTSFTQIHIALTNFLTF